MLETGLFHVSQTQKELEDKVARRVLSLSPALLLLTHVVWHKLLVNCGGKVRGGVGKAAMQTEMISTKVIPKLACMTLLSLDKRVSTVLLTAI